MRAIIISVGNELTSGQTLDTNGAYLARQLGWRGIAVTSHVTIGDDSPLIAATIARAAAEADIVMVSGGLGPTDDDLTRQALAGAMGCELELNEACLGELEAHFAVRGWPMAQSNRSQAMLPAGARAIANTCGTAPGIAAKIGSADIYVTPGVPAEMHEMFEKQIAPLLPLDSGCILHRTVHTFGSGESTVGEKVADLMGRDNPMIGTRVSSGVVSIRITARGETSQAAEALIEQSTGEIESRLGDIVFGYDGDTLASVVGELLKARSATLSVAESCTGGIIGGLVTQASGSSEYFLGGVITYANEVKHRELRVPESLLAELGAVSEPVAKAMAEGARVKFASTYAISVTGIAGPTGGTDEKPVGLVYIGLAGPDSTEVHRHQLSGDRAKVRLRAARTALNHLRLELLSQ